MQKPGGERVLEEHDVLSRTQQYDLGIVYAAPLQSLGLTSLGTALHRCECLTVLDISRNALRSLEGLCYAGSTRSQLTFLNAAENQLVDISALTACPRLQRVWLESNRLASRAALEPLAKLPELAEVRLSRSIEVDGAPLTLDNPVCANTESYASLTAALFPQVRWVDDRLFRGPATSLLPLGHGGNARSGEDDTSLRAATDRLERATREAQASTADELRFSKLLAA